MRNPFKRKKPEPARQLTVDEQLVVSKQRLIDARKHRAVQLDQSTKWRGRSLVLINIIVAALTVFELVSLGADLDRHYYASSIVDALLAVMFGGMLLFAALDTKVDADMGRHLRTTLVEALDKAEKVSKHGGIK